MSSDRLRFWNSGCASGWYAFDDGTVRHVVLDQRCRPEIAVVSDLPVGKNGDICADNAVLSDRYFVRHHAVRKNKCVVANPAFVTDLTAAPNNDIPAYFSERLDDHMFADKTMLADTRVWADTSGRTKIRRYIVSLSFTLLVKTRAQAVKMRKYERGKNGGIPGWIELLPILESDNRLGE